MSTYTSVLSLRKPNRIGGEDDIVNVVTDVNENMDTLDLNVNLRVVTSSTRPSSPYTGQLVYETDTGHVSIWNGTDWDNVGAGNSARGRMALTTSTTDGASLTSASAETLYISATFAAEDGRKYWVETGFSVECTATTAAPGAIDTKVRWAAGGSVANTDTQLGSTARYDIVQGTGTANAEHGYHLYELTPNTTGNVTVGLFASVPTVNDTCRFDGSAVSGDGKVNWISVRDVGSE